MVATALIGCNHNYIKVVDLDQETLTCRSADNDQQAFVYPNAEFGVCMDKNLANYLYCVNTISLIQVSSNSESSIGGDIGNINEVLSSVSISSKAKEKIVQTMASEGKLAEARADAIEYCKSFAK